MIHPLARLPFIRVLSDARRRRIEAALSKALTLHQNRLALLRRFHPIIGHHWIVLVTRASDVRDVLSAPDLYHVPYLPKIHETTRAFLLGLDGTKEYWTVRRAIVDARDNMKFDLRKRSREVAEARLSKVGASRGGRAQLDVIGDLTDFVIADAMEKYLGVRPSGDSQLRYGRELFAGIFLNDFDSDEVRVKAREAATVLANEVCEEMARRNRGERGDDFLGLLMNDPQGVSDEQIRLTMAGLISAWTTSVSRAMGLAVDVLLDNPRLLEELRAKLTTAAIDGSEVWGYLREAMRFRPPAPAVMRTSVAQQRIAQGVLHERRLAQGAAVMSLLGSAMMDKTAVQNPGPEAFCPHRRDEVYLHFGYGLHECFGRKLAEQQMTGIGEALLRRKLRRVEPLEWEGPYPRRLLVEVGPSA